MGEVALGWAGVAGRRALAASGSGEHQGLSGVEQAALRQAILDHQLCGPGLCGQLWTRGQGRRADRDAVPSAPDRAGVGKYLRRWGLTFQRPDKRGAEQDTEAVRVWWEETCWRSGRGPGLRVSRCSSPTRSASAPTASPAARPPPPR
ncbi:winged helix-turn-helix domain-containing protein [Streptomyces olivoreticuli]